MGTTTPRLRPVLKTVAALTVFVFTFTSILPAGWAHPESAEGEQPTLRVNQLESEEAKGGLEEALKEGEIASASGLAMTGEGSPTGLPGNDSVGLEEIPLAEPSVITSPPASPSLRAPEGGEAISVVQVDEPTFAKALDRHDRDRAIAARIAQSLQEITFARFLKPKPQPAAPQPKTFWQKFRPQEFPPEKTPEQLREELFSDEEAVRQFLLEFLLADPDFARMIRRAEKGRIPRQRLEAAMAEFKTLRSIPPDQYEEALFKLIQRLYLGREVPLNLKLERKTTDAILWSQRLAKQLVARVKGIQIPSHKIDQPEYALAKIMDPEETISTHTIQAELNRMQMERLFNPDSKPKLDALHDKLRTREEVGFGALAGLIFEAFHPELAASPLVEAEPIQTDWKQIPEEPEEETPTESGWRPVLVGAGWAAAAIAAFTGIYLFAHHAAHPDSGSAQPQPEIPQPDSAAVEPADDVQAPSVLVTQPADRAVSDLPVVERVYVHDGRVPLKRPQLPSRESQPRIRYPVWQPVQNLYASMTVGETPRGPKVIQWTVPSRHRLVVPPAAPLAHTYQRVADDIIRDVDKAWNQASALLRKNPVSWHAPPLGPGQELAVTLWDTSMLGKYRKDDVASMFQKMGESNGRLLFGTEPALYFTGYASYLPDVERIVKEWSFYTLLARKAGAKVSPVSGAPGWASPIGRGIGLQHLELMAVAYPILNWDRAYLDIEAWTDLQWTFRLEQLEKTEDPSERQLLLSELEEIAWNWYEFHLLSLERLRFLPVKLCTFVPGPGFDPDTGQSDPLSFVSILAASLKKHEETKFDSRLVPVVMAHTDLDKIPGSVQAVSDLLGVPAELSVNLEAGNALGISPEQAKRFPKADLEKFTAHPAETLYDEFQRDPLGTASELAKKAQKTQSPSVVFNVEDLDAAFALGTPRRVDWADAFWANRNLKEARGQLGNIFNYFSGERPEPALRERNLDVTLQIESKRMREAYHKHSASLGQSFATGWLGGASHRRSLEMVQSLILGNFRFHWDAPPGATESIHLRWIRVIQGSFAATGFPTIEAVQILEEETQPDGTAVFKPMTEDVLGTNAIIHLADNERKLKLQLTVKRDPNFSIHQSLDMAIAVRLGESHWGSGAEVQREKWVAVHIPPEEKYGVAAIPLPPLARGVNVYSVKLTNENKEVVELVGPEDPWARATGWAYLCDRYFGELKEDRPAELDSSTMGQIANDLTELGIEAGGRVTQIVRMEAEDLKDPKRFEQVLKSTLRRNSIQVLSLKIPGIQSSTFEMIQTFKDVNIPVTAMVFHGRPELKGQVQAAVGIAHRHGLAVYLELGSDELRAVSDAGTKVIQKEPAELRDTFHLMIDAGDQTESGIAGIFVYDPKGQYPNLRADAEAVAVQLGSLPIFAGPAQDPENRDPQRVSTGRSLYASTVPLFDSEGEPVPADRVIQTVKGLADAPGSLEPFIGPRQKMVLLDGKDLFTTSGWLGELPRMSDPDEGGRIREVLRDRVRVPTTDALVRIGLPRPRPGEGENSLVEQAKKFARTVKQERFDEALWKDHAQHHLALAVTGVWAAELERIADTPDHTRLNTDLERVFQVGVGRSRPLPLIHAGLGFAQVEMPGPPAMAVAHGESVPILFDLTHQGSTDFGLYKVKLTATHFNEATRRHERYDWEMLADLDKGKTERMYLEVNGLSKGIFTYRISALSYSKGTSREGVPSDLLGQELRLSITGGTALVMESQESAQAWNQQHLAEQVEKAWERLQLDEQRLKELMAIEKGLDLKQIPEGAPAETEEEFARRKANRFDLWVDKEVDPAVSLRRQLQEAEAAQKEREIKALSAEEPELRRLVAPAPADKPRDLVAYLSIAGVWILIGSVLGTVISSIRHRKFRKGSAGLEEPVFDIEAVEMKDLLSIRTYGPRASEWTTLAGQLDRFRPITAANPRLAVLSQKSRDGTHTVRHESEEREETFRVLASDIYEKIRKEKLTLRSQRQVRSLLEGFYPRIADAIRLPMQAPTGDRNLVQEPQHLDQLVDDFRSRRPGILKGGLFGHNKNRCIRNIENVIRRPAPPNDLFELGYQSQLMIGTGYVTSRIGRLNAEIMLGTEFSKDENWVKAVQDLLKELKVPPSEVEKKIVKRDTPGTEVVSIDLPKSPSDEDWAKVNRLRRLVGQAFVRIEVEKDSTGTLAVDKSVLDIPGGNDAAHAEAFFKRLYVDSAKRVTPYRRQGIWIAQDVSAQMFGDVRKNLNRYIRAVPVHMDVRHWTVFQRAYGEDPWNKIKKGDFWGIQQKDRSRDLVRHSAWGIPGALVFFVAYLFKPALAPLLLRLPALLIPSLLTLPLWGQVAVGMAAIAILPVFLNWLTRVGTNSKYLEKTDREEMKKEKWGPRLMVKTWAPAIVRFSAAALYYILSIPKVVAAFFGGCLALGVARFLGHEPDRPEPKPWLANILFSAVEQVMDFLVPLTVTFQFLSYEPSMLMRRMMDAISIRPNVTHAVGFGLFLGLGAIVAVIVGFPFGASLLGWSLAVAGLLINPFLAFMDQDPNRVKGYGVGLVAAAIVAFSVGSAWWTVLAVAAAVFLVINVTSVFDSRRGGIGHLLDLRPFLGPALGLALLLTPLGQIIAAYKWWLIGPAFVVHALPAVLLWGWGILFALSEEGKTFSEKAATARRRLLEDRQGWRVPCRVVLDDIWTPFHGVFDVMFMIRDSAAIPFVLSEPETVLETALNQRGRWYQGTYYVKQAQLTGARLALSLAHWQGRRIAKQESLPDLVERHLASQDRNLRSAARWRLVQDRLREMWTLMIGAPSVVATRDLDPAEGVKKENLTPDQKEDRDALTHLEEDLATSFVGADGHYETYMQGVEVAPVLVLPYSVQVDPPDPARPNIMRVRLKKEITTQRFVLKGGAKNMTKGQKLALIRSWAYEEGVMNLSTGQYELLAEKHLPWFKDFTTALGSLRARESDRANLRLEASSPDDHVLGHDPLLRLDPAQRFWEQIGLGIVPLVLGRSLAASSFGLIKGVRHLFNSREGDRRALIGRVDPDVLGASWNAYLRKEGSGLEEDEAALAEETITKVEQVVRRTLAGLWGHPLARLLDFGTADKRAKAQMELIHGKLRSYRALKHVAQVLAKRLKMSPQEVEKKLNTKAWGWLVFEYLQHPLDINDDWVLETLLGRSARQIAENLVAQFLEDRRRDPKMRLSLEQYVRVHSPLAPDLDTVHEMFTDQNADLGAKWAPALYNLHRFANGITAKDEKEVTRWFEWRKRRAAEAKKAGPGISEVRDAMRGTEDFSEEFKAGRLHLYNVRSWRHRLVAGLAAGIGIGALAACFLAAPVALAIGAGIGAVTACMTQSPQWSRFKRVGLLAGAAMFGASLVKAGGMSVALSGLSLPVVGALIGGSVLVGAVMAGLYWLLSGKGLISLPAIGRVVRGFALGLIGVGLLYFVPALQGAVAFGVIAGLTAAFINAFVPALWITGGRNWRQMGALTGIAAWIAVKMGWMAGLFKVMGLAVGGVTAASPVGIVVVGTAAALATLIFGLFRWLGHTPLYSRDVKILCRLLGSSPDQFDGYWDQSSWRFAFKLPWIEGNWYLGLPVLGWIRGGVIPAEAPPLSMIEALTTLMIPEEVSRLSALNVLPLRRAYAILEATTKAEDEQSGWITFADLDWIEEEGELRGAAPTGTPLPPASMEANPVVMHLAGELNQEIESVRRATEDALGLGLKRAQERLFEIPLFTEEENGAESAHRGLLGFADNSRRPFRVRLVEPATDVTSEVYQRLYVTFDSAEEGGQPEEAVLSINQEGYVVDGPYQGAFVATASILLEKLWAIKPYDTLQLTSRPVAYGVSNVLNQLTAWTGTDLTLGRTNASFMPGAPNALEVASYLDDPNFADRAYNAMEGEMRRMARLLTARQGVHPLDIAEEDRAWAALSTLGLRNLLDRATDPLERDTLERMVELREAMDHWGRTAPILRRFPAIARAMRQQVDADGVDPYLVFAYATGEEAVTAGLEQVRVGQTEKWRGTDGVVLGELVPVFDHAGEPVGRALVPDFKQIEFVSAWTGIDDPNYPRWRQASAEEPDVKRQREMEPNFLDVGQSLEGWKEQLQQAPPDLDGSRLVMVSGGQQNNFIHHLGPLVIRDRVFRQRYAQLRPAEYPIDQEPFWAMVLSSEGAGPRVTALRFQRDEQGQEVVAGELVNPEIQNGQPAASEIRRNSRIGHAIVGVPVVLGSQDVSDQIRSNWISPQSRRALRPNEVTWDPKTTKAAFSAIGIRQVDGIDQLVLVYVTEELTIGEFAQLLLQLGIRDAILLEGSAGVQQWIDGDYPVLKAKAQSNSSRPGIGRPLNIVLALYAQPAAGLEAKRFPDPVLDEAHPFRSRMDQEEVTYLNRHLIQEEWLSNEVLPVLVERNRATQEITLAVLGASTGEEIARFWHWIIRWLEKQDYAGWKVKVLAVEVNPALIEEAKARLSGEEGHPLAYAVWKSDRERSPNIEKDVQAFSNEIAATVERDVDLIEQAVEWIPGSMTDSHILERIVSADPDIVISNVASSYLSSNERITLWKTLTSRTSAWIGATDEFLRTAAEPPRGFEERLVEAGQQPLLEPASPIALPYYFSAPAAGLEQKRSDSMASTEFAGGLRISAAYYSHIGGRPSQMDRAGIVKQGLGRPGGLPVAAAFIVADGVGKAWGSEEAAQAVVDLIPEYLNMPENPAFVVELAEQYLAASSDADRRKLERRIRERIRRAIRQAHGLIRKDPDHIQTTGTLLLVIGRTAFVGAVGNTEAYLLEGSGFRRLGRYDQEKTLSWQTIGGGIRTVHTAVARNLEAGSVLGIFTDGVHKKVSRSISQNVMGAERSSEDKARMLIHFAQPQGSAGDNKTAMVVHIEAAGLEQGGIASPRHGGARNDERAGYIFRPHEAGMAILLLKQFTYPDSNPAVFYALVRSPEQARALVQAGVDPLRIVAWGSNPGVEPYVALGIPGDNILTDVSQEKNAIEWARGMLKIVYGLEPVFLPGDLANTAQALLAQIGEWLDAQGWKADRPLTLPEAEAILEINGMA